MKLTKKFVHQIKIKNANVYAAKFINFVNLRNVQTKLLIYTNG